MVNNLIPGNGTCGRDCSSQDWKAGLERPFNSLQKPTLSTGPHFLKVTQLPKIAPPAVDQVLKSMRGSVFQNQTIVIFGLTVIGIYLDFYNVIFNLITCFKGGENKNPSAECGLD